MDSLKYGIYINKTSKDFSERGFETILAIVLSVGSLVLLGFFPLFGIALIIFAYGFLCVGTKSYLLSIANGEFLPVESVFSKYRICVKAFCLKIATMLLEILWGLVFIIPGIICMLNYSMSSFVMADEDLPALDCMVKSKKLVKGHRFEIFVVYLAYIFVIVATLCVCTSLTLAINYFLKPQVWISFVALALVALFLIFIFVVPYFELMFANIYVVLKKEYLAPTKSKKKSKKKKLNKQELLKNEDDLKIDEAQTSIVEE